MAKSVRIVINKEAFVQFTPESEFDFREFCDGVRLRGYFQNETIYVPLVQIETIIFADFDKVDEGFVHTKGTTVQ